MASRSPAGCLALFLLLAAPAAAQHPPRLQFDSFPAGPIYRGAPAPVDLASADGARHLRTVLREGAAKGPNFAGGYTVVQWGCGSPCQTYAIVDARTGAVVFPGIATQAGADFRLTSSLFIADPPQVLRAQCRGQWKAAACTGMYSYFYRWIQDHMVLIDSVLVDSTRSK